MQVHRLLAKGQLHIIDSNIMFVSYLSFFKNDKKVSHLGGILLMKFSNHLCWSYYVPVSWAPSLQIVPVIWREVHMINALNLDNTYVAANDLRVISL